MSDQVAIAPCSVVEWVLLQFDYYSIQIRMEFLHTALPSDVRKRLCPSVSAELILRGYAPGGAAPGIITLFAEGRSHFRTSGGKAVATKRIVYPNDE
ncbi:MAG TPA: hypothetical protein VIF64_06585 [Pyrinomonadaceae bacterium]